MKPGPARTALARHVTRAAPMATVLRRYLVNAALPVFALVAQPALAQQPTTIWEQIGAGNASYDPRLNEVQRWIAEGNFQAAVSQLTDLLQQSPDSVTTAALLARSHIGLMQFAEALAVCETALAQGAEPDEPLRFFQAYALAFLNRTDEAADVLTDVTQFRTELPDLHIYLSNLAELRLIQGDLTGAQTLWQQAITRSPSYAPALVGHVFTLVGSGRSAEAASIVRRELFRQPDLLPELVQTTDWLAEGLDLPFRILATRSGIVDPRGVEGMADALRSTPVGARIQQAIDELLAAANAPSPVQRIDRAPCPFQSLSRSQDGARWAGVCNAGGIRLGTRNPDGTIAWRPRRSEANGTNSTLQPDIRISADGQTITLLNSPVRVQTLPFNAAQTDAPTPVPIDDTVQALYQASNCLFSPGGTHFACFANTTYAGDEAVIIDTSDMTISDRGYFAVANCVVRLSEDGSRVVGNSESAIVQGVSGNMYPSNVLSLNPWLAWSDVLPMALSADGLRLAYWHSNHLTLLDMESFTPIDQWRLEAATVAITATAFDTFLIATNDAVYEWNPAVETR
jgi:tetratricopeptide (TPR) repeat protein